MKNKMRFSILKNPPLIVLILLYALFNITIYFSQGIKNVKPLEDVIASATRTVVDEFSKKELCLKKLLEN